MPLAPSPSVDSMSFMSSDEVLLCCENCHRDAIDNVIVVSRDSIGISFKKKLCNMAKKPQLMALYDLCNECYNMLLGRSLRGREVPRFKYDWETCWPAFFGPCFSIQTTQTLLNCCGN